ncbi:hypothetical protein ACFVW8_21310 [Streptomyces sp. NPDC058221]|uniref:hypothetical protein n=1 Tax=Streptomyces sp. NPDC058221 TaxID=3346388 RepID=UPI0036E36E14
MPPTPPPPATPPEHPAPLPPGRTRHGLVLGLAAASVVPAVVLGGPATATAAPQRNPASTPAAPLASVLPAAAPAVVGADQQPACGDPEAAEFPIDTRIHGGPDSYASGGGYGTWFLDLTNTTSRTCRSIHPVLVFTDDDRRLTSDQIQLKFSERAHPDVEHRVTWETTDRHEHIGVFGGEGDESFGGFTVPAGHTVTVQVRLAFTSDTSPGRITANAAIVQRKAGASGRSDSGATAKGSDGEWVGESEDYSFTVVEDGGRDGMDSSGTGKESDGSGEVGEDRETGGTGRESDGTGKEDGRLPDGTRPSASSDGGTTGNPRPVAPGRDPAGVPELARTGIPVLMPQSALTVSGFLIGGGAVVVWSRRMRRARR